MNKMTIPGNTPKEKIETLIEVYQKKNYPVFLGQEYPYNLNLGGIRNFESVVDRWDDILFVWWTYKGEYYLIEAEGTTDPGKFYSENLMNPKGVAVLPEGFYKGVFKLGEHKGYPALQQWRSMTIDRVMPDGTKTQDFGLFGINFHRANRWWEVPFVGKYSAGCQVVRKYSDWEKFISVFQSGAKLWGELFSYGLLNSKDF